MIEGQEKYIGKHGEESISSIILILLFLCGCGQEQEAASRVDAEALNEPVLVSEFTNLAVDLSGEEKEPLRKLVDNAYLHTYRIYDPTYDIVWEECGAYFAGDRTARETAEIIQNRVQLYLDETD